MPLGRVGGTSISLSYSVLIAASVLIGVVAACVGQQGNSDLFVAALIGVLFWTSGWLIQTLTASLYCVLAGMRFHAVMMGLVGVEPKPHGWTAARTLGLSVACLGSLAGCGLAIWIAGVDSTASATAKGSAALWQAPSLGMTDSDSLWRAGAWLLWIQTLCQACPLPRTLGRLGLISVVSIASRSTSTPEQTLLVRRSLFFAAFVVTLIAISLVQFENSLAVPRWPLLLLLAVLLGTSTRAPDIGNTLDAFRQAASLPGTRDRRESMAAKLNQRLMDRRNRRRLAAAVHREREEAVDAARLDDILQRLHGQGLDSLSSSDRAVLRRVSETLRQHRQKQDSAE